MAPVGRLPAGQIVDLPERGSTYVVDCPSASPDRAAPTFILLHSLACTGMLTWYPALELMRQFGRVIVFDQRWHGQGISCSRFLLEDCADDAAALADELGVETFVPVGFSMGSLVAQLVWRRHRSRVDGLVLCAAAAAFGRAPHERLATGLFAALVEAFTPTPWPQRAPVVVKPADQLVADWQWAGGQFRSTGYGAMARVTAEITRFDSTRWISDIDVPTSLVIPRRDRIIPPRHQNWLAHRIPDAHAVRVDAGHACCTLRPDRFVPGLGEAVEWVTSRAPARSRALRARSAAIRHPLRRSVAENTG